ncbi:MAG: VWA domain-containing protein [Deltaproteobacteria bacterium]|nr:VWA domain-containing protein [Deltaproteobacteria bacterium]
MDRILENFILALRGSGVRVSVAESIDAMHVTDLIGYGDRGILKNALSAALAKTLTEKEIFHMTFDRFFSTDVPFDHAYDIPDAMKGEPDEEIPFVAQMILSGNMAGLAVAMSQAALSVDITGIQFFTQKGLYVRRLMQQMGLDELNDYIRELRANGDDESTRIANMLEEGREDLTDRARKFVERQYDLYAGSATEGMIESYLRNARLTNIEQHHYQQIRVIIRKMVKNLRDLHTRRKKGAKRGQLDFKKTMRSNIAYQGLPFDTRWKMKKIDRPKIMVICDVSRSVSTIVRFFLLILYSLNELIEKIDTFIFCSNLVEASSIFDKYDLEEAVVRLQTGTGLDIWMGRTDYGQSLRDFWEGWSGNLTNKTTVIILGDARSNFGEPEVGILKRMQERSKRIIWLNPETPSLWGSGDSEMKRYLPFCHIARECNTLNHLERAIHALL